MSSWDVQEWLLLYLPCLDFCFSLFSLATVGSLFFFFGERGPIDFSYFWMYVAAGGFCNFDASLLCLFYTV